MLEGERVRFAHPLLASICYQQAPAKKRRSAHRLLAGTVADVEERARHLALAAEGPDAITAAELDAAADHAAARGATAAGAELSELATTRRDDLPKMVAPCDEALAAAADDAARCTRILAYRSWAYLFEAEIDAALRDARAALRVDG